jgi:cytochrome c oxidase subunit II
MTRDLRMRWLTPALALLLAVGLSACNSFTPNTIFGAHSEFGHSVDVLTRRLLYAGLVVFVLIETLLVVILVRFRDRDGNREAKQFHGNSTLEIGWTLVPAVILAFIAVPTIKTIFKTQAKAVPGALQVEVIGHQWWWEFRYPDLNIVTANELYVPVGQPMTIKLTGADVIHSFWVPQFGWKMDAIPGRTTTMNVTVDKTGTFQGTCTEYCGDEHAWMRIKVVAQAPTQFDAWVKAQQQPAIAPQGDIAVAGDKLFLSSTCISCHTVRGGGGNGTIGPDLTHVGSRTTLAAGVIDNTPQNLADWIRDPAAIKPGVRMPASNFTDQEIQALVAYLESLK